MENRRKEKEMGNREKEKLRKQQQLERNLQLLKNLEEEYKKEQEDRKKLNERLEAEGAKTLPEKLALMGKEANKKAEETGTSLLDETNKVLTQVRKKEILEGQMMQENWENKRKMFRGKFQEAETVIKNRPYSIEVLEANVEKLEKSTKLSVES